MDAQTMHLYNNSALILLTLASVSVALGHILKKRTSRARRTRWSRGWLLRRKGRGTLALLNTELRFEDPEAYRNFLRLDTAQFNVLLNLVRDDINKQDTLMRESISAEHRLNVTLRFLATGESFRSLMYSTRIHESTISKFIPEVCRAIYKHLKVRYIKTPHTQEDWAEIAVGYEKNWNFPNCIGALDGRHISFSPPISAGSYYHNYKGTSSIVLLGLVDANYRFIYINVGVNGRVSDGGVFNESLLSRKLRDKALKLPEPRQLSATTAKVPYVIVADDAFPLSENLMKPYPTRNLTYEQRIYNYRLSRARRVVECAFGILANRWRVLLGKIHLGVDKVEAITLACIALHNFLAVENSNYTEGVYDEEYREQLPQIIQQMSNRSALSSRSIREEFKDYFNSDCGSVSWQHDAVQRGN